MFWFVVPLPACRPPVSAPSHEIVSRGPFRILLAEDNAVNRLVATRLLIRRGHHVETAENGVQALEALSAKTYDPLLTDVMMPDMDGLELTRRIRALPGALARLPIIGLTAKSGELDVEECISTGMDGHVAKPAVPDTLERMIQAAMDAAFIPPASNEPPPPATQLSFDAQALIDLTEAIGAASVTEVLDQFRSGIDPTVGLVRRLAAEADMTALASTARSVGLEAVGAAARALERDLISGSAHSAAVKVEAIAALIVRDMHWLSQLEPVT